MEDWKTQLIDLLREPHMIETAFRHKAPFIPQKLYKYRSVNPFSLENLENDTTWISDPNNFNDPFDSGLKINYEEIGRIVFLKHFDAMDKYLKFNNVFDQGQIEAIRKSDNPFEEFSNAMTKKAIAEIKDYDKYLLVLNQMMKESREKHLLEFNKNIKTSLKVSCFSEVNNSVLMWSHYASNHEGFCVEYNFKDLPINNFNNRFMYPVIYGDELFDITELIKNGTNDMNPFFALIASIHKSEGWAYEKEWRMVFASGLPENESNWPVSTPTGVYLGAKISDKDKERLVLICKTKNIPLFQMVNNAWDYDMNFISVNY